MMPSQSPSIQSYLHRMTKPMQVDSQAPDAAKESQVANVPKPDEPTSSLNVWKPRDEYLEMDIINLEPGLGRVTMTGRIANFYEMTSFSNMPSAAKGSFKIILKDKTGAFMVKLWYADTVYELKLGMLVSIWTPHIAQAPNYSAKIHKTKVMTSIFPERDNTCHLLKQRDEDSFLCRTPLGYKSGKELDGLMTLKRFIEVGHKVPGSRVLVCVKSVGGKKTVPAKDNKPAKEKLDVVVFDETEETTFTLWNCSIRSAAGWQPSDTTLLITDANLKIQKNPCLGLKSDSLVDVNPLIEDTYWLREYAQGLKKKECVNHAFPENVFDVQTAEESEERILFTLADIDRWVRANPSENFVGWLNLTIIEMNLVSLYRRKKLLCEECCGLPIYANATKAQCRNCKNLVILRLNPKIIGLLIDETGGITSGRAIWSEEAWWQLLGRTPEGLVTSNKDMLQYLDHRLLFLKITVMFGWSYEVGRIAILKLKTL